MEWDKPSKALEKYQAALTWLIPAFNPADRFENPSTKQLYTEYLISAALQGKAKSLFALSTEHETETSLLEIAIQTFELADVITKSLLQHQIMEGSQIATLNEQRTHKEIELETAYTLWVEQNNPKWEDKLLSVSEQCRALLVLEQHDITARLDKTEKMLQDQYFQLKHQITEIETNIYQFSQDSKDNPILDSLYQQQLQLHQQLDLTAKKILTGGDAQDTEYFNVPLSISDIQQELDSNQILLEYFVGEKCLFIFRITKDGFIPLQKTLPADFRGKVDQMRKALTDQPIINRLNYRPGFIESASQLHDLLLKEALENLPDDKNRLLIIPDGLLNFIPFELLLTTPTNTDASYDSLPYLIRKYSIGYAPSIKLYLRQKNRSSTGTERLFAGFAPSYNCQSIFATDTIYSPAVQQDSSINKAIAGYMERSGDCNLPGARKEVTSIQNILGGKMFLGQQASEKHFKEIAHHYRILLLAMHSLINENNHDFTRLLFTEKASATTEDDILHAVELRNLKLNADLVALSACNTGYGPLEPGEDVMSLSRAFFSAGVPSTVMSLWSVPDDGTSEIMQNFFANLKNGLQKDEAMRLAKLEYLGHFNSPQKAHPYYWAGFIVTGKMDALELERHHHWPWWLIGIGLLMAGSFYVRSGSRFPFWKN